MTYRTLDNDRGERRAAELRQRFKRVSNASLGRKGSANPFSWKVRDKGRKADDRKFGFWLTAALCAMAIALFF